MTASLELTRTRRRLRATMAPESTIDIDLHADRIAAAVTACRAAPRRPTVVHDFASDKQLTDLLLELVNRKGEAA